MLFNSYIFVMAFLPICVIGWFALNRLKKPVYASVFMLVMSLWFYGYFNIKYLPILVASVLVNYGIYRLMMRRRARAAAGEEPGENTGEEADENTGEKAKTTDRGLRLLLALALLFNLGLLFYFKYYDFFFENVNAVFGTGFTLHHVVLPLGISFFTFQQLSFVIDTYRGDTPEYPFLDYALFITFFPQLIAGPIVTHDEVVPQFGDREKRRFNWDNFAPGLYLFILGLGKKVLIADVFGGAVTYGFENIEILSSFSALVTILSYSFQIYFDFSGYCDMAMGAAKMLNIDLPLNFNMPYKSLTIIDFWKRWHITLTRFLTRYVYFPLGGSRKGKARTYINIFIVYLVSGLWHGANWTFVIWGVLHGLFVMLTRARRQFFEKLHPALGWMITFFFISVTRVFFRADNLADAWLMLKTAFGLGGPGIITGLNPSIIYCFERTEIWFLTRQIFGMDITDMYPYIYFILYLLVALFCSVGGRNARQTLEAFRPNVLRMLFAAVAREPSRIPGAI